MKKAIEDAYEKKDIVCNVKYIDPSYMIRWALALRDSDGYGSLS